jgi:hypothetical protein
MGTEQSELLSQVNMNINELEKEINSLPINEEEFDVCDTKLIQTLRSIARVLESLDERKS